MVNGVYELTGNEEPYHSFFRNNGKLIRASSPGRLDVMGGIADYSGSLLLQKTIREMTTVTIGERDDGVIRIRSLSASESIFTFPADLFYSNNGLKDDFEFRSDILKIKGGEWAVYIAGCFFLLAKDLDIKPNGADVLVESSVPMGKGVSSSAALEVAVLMVLDRLYELGLGRLELPLMAQKVENRIVGAPCGLMDQLTSYLGREDALLPIVCQPVEIYPAVEIPGGIHFVGIDSGIRHAVSGASYAGVRTAAFMGYSIIAGSMGVDSDLLRQARKSGHWEELPYRGYLANIDVEEFEMRFMPMLPEQMTGADFLNRFEVVIDPVTEPQPGTTYAVRNCASHPVYENRRVSVFRDGLVKLQNYAGPERHEILRQLGNLMYEAHTGYTLCGLGNERTDELVRMVRSRGYDYGLYGAKITGGGSGGTVCVLCDGDKGLDSAREIGQTYSRKYDLPFCFFEGDVDGGYYQ